MQENIHNYAQSTLSFASILSTCQRSIHISFLFFSVSFVMFPIYARRIRKKNGKRQKKNGEIISFNYDHTMNISHATQQFLHIYIYNVKTAY